ncbi:NAD(P)H-binding protein [Streptomyces sp. NPDC047071]|uniref:NAD(P)H-binding protein n=1 Tax=Streptomyces sp. NPDC047071 TaxID=3154808 RepID=UPI003454E957
MRVVVAGASGTVGRLVVGELEAGHYVRALTRDPRAAVRAGVGGVKVRADFGDRASLERALAGMDALLLITSDPLRPDHDERVLEAAVRAGVGHVVKVSALAVTDTGAGDVITCWQRMCEQRVRECGLAWTVLRPRAFMSKALAWAPSVRERGVVRAVYGSSVNACVDPADVAAVAARVLTTPGHGGRCYELTGPGPVCAREQTRVLGRVLGRALRFEEMGVDEAWRLWRSRYPEPYARALVESAERQRAGAKAGVSPGVRQVMGRAPAGFADWARRHARFFG